MHEPHPLPSMLLSTQILCFAFWIAGSLAADSAVVFHYGEGGYPCIRIPSITRCGGLLHAFAECRTRTGDGCVPSVPPGEAGAPQLLVPDFLH